MSESTTTSGGIGFMGLLTILFVGLKLTHYIDWRWRWVLAPLWIGVAFWLAFIVGVLVVAGFCLWMDSWKAPQLTRRR